MSQIAVIGATGQVGRELVSYIYRNKLFPIFSLLGIVIH